MQTSPADAAHRPVDFTSAAFLIVAFLTGIAGALQTPTLSLFLTNEVHARPAMVGFFFTGSAVIGILVSQFLAGRSDRKGSRKNLIVFCCLLGMLACVLLYSAVYRGLSKQLRLYRQPADVCPRPRAR